MQPQNPTPPVSTPGQPIAPQAPQPTTPVAPQSTTAPVQSVGSSQPPYTQTANPVYGGAMMPTPTVPKTNPHLPLIIAIVGSATMLLIAVIIGVVMFMKQADTRTAEVENDTPAPAMTESVAKPDTQVSPESLNNSQKPSQYSPELQQAFISECMQGNATRAQCTCALTYVEARITVEELEVYEVEMRETGRFPIAFEEVLYGAINECR